MTIKIKNRLRTLPVFVTMLAAIFILVLLIDVPVKAGSNETTPVARIDGREYTTIDAAVEAAEDNDTIILINDAQAQNTLVFSKNVTLNLSSYTLEASFETSKKAPLIKVTSTGSLTIDAEDWLPGSIITNDECAILLCGVENAESSPGGGELIINNGNITAKDGTITIDNYNSNLRVSGGTIKGRYAIEDFIGDCSIVVDSGTIIGEGAAMVIGYDSEVSIGGGKLESTANDSSAIYVLGISEINVYDGIIKGYSYGIYQAAEGKYCDLNIKGGTISGRRYSVAGYNIGNKSSVSGGYFEGMFYFSNSKKIITGGHFNPTVSNDYIVDGYEQDEQGRVSSTYAAVVSNGETETNYSTLKDAVAAARDGDMVTLLDNIYLKESLEIYKDIILNTGSYGLYNDRSFNTTRYEGLIVINGGNVTIKSSGGKGISTENEGAIQIKDGNVKIHGINIAAKTTPIYVAGTEASLEIEDAAVVSQKYVAIDCYKGNVNINNATIKSEGEDSVALRVSNKNSIVVIDYSLFLAETALDVVKTGTNISVINGEFHGDVESETTGFISGGLFYDGIELDYCKAGYVPILEENVEEEIQYYVVCEGWRITYDANGGTGKMETASLKKGDLFTTPYNRFKAPEECAVFGGWLVGDSTEAVGEVENIEITADTVIKPLWKMNHNWENAEYEWSEDNSSVTATCRCKHCDLIETETVATTSEVTKEPSVKEEGERTFTATFEKTDLFETQTKKVIIPKLDPVDPGKKDEPGKEDGKQDGGSKEAKADNTLKVKAKTVKIKYAKLKKKAQSIKINKAVKVTAPQGKVTFKKISVGSKKINKKYGKKFLVNAKTGKITVKKGVKKGTYKLKIKVTAAGNEKFNAGSKTVVVKIRVK